MSWKREIDEYIRQEEAWLKATEPFHRALGHAIAIAGVASILTFIGIFIAAFFRA